MSPSDQQPDKSRVLRRDRFRRVACGFGLRSVLVLHHVVPRELGGVDVIGNLRTLCPNCHRMAHWLSGVRHLEGEAATQVKRAVSRGTFVTLRELASRIRRQRQRTRLERAWVKGSHARGPLPLRKALTRIAIRNGLDREEEGLMRSVLKRDSVLLDSP